MAMTLRLTEQQSRDLALLAEAGGVSKHEAAVRAITEAAARSARGERIDELSSAARSRYAELLARLAHE